MKGTRFFFCFGILGIAAACGGSDGTGDGTFQPGTDGGSDARPGTSTSGGTSSGGTRDGAVDDPDAATSSSSSGEPDGGSSADGGASSGSGGSSGAPPLCAGDSVPGAELGTVLQLGAPAPSAVTLSDDGLTVAWVTGTAGDIVVHHADRPNVAAAFGSEQTLAGAWAVDRVALGEVGLLLVMVRHDRLGFDAYTRAERGQPFTPSERDIFVNLNEQSAAMTEAGQSYANPVLARFDSYFVYSLQGAGVTDSLRLGTKLPVSIPYSVGSSFTSAPFLLASGDRLRRPVSLSPDQRTLFYFDDTNATSYSTTRDGNGGEFAAPVSLGPRLDARPVPGCGALVYRDPSVLSELRSIAFQ